MFNALHSSRRLSFNELTNAKILCRIVVILFSTDAAARLCARWALYGGIWKHRISSFKCYVDHSHTLYISGNKDARNWIHIFESRCIFIRTSGEACVPSNKGMLFRVSKSTGRRRTPTSLLPYTSDQRSNVHCKPFNTADKLFPPCHLSSYWNQFSYHEDGGSTFFRNVGIFSHCNVQKPKIRA